MLYSRLQNLPSILALRVSRALELRIGLQVKLRAELQGGDPLGPPLRTACSIYRVGRALAEALVECLVELLQSFVWRFVQSFCRASVELRAEPYVEPYAGVCTGD